MPSCYLYEILSTFFMKCSVEAVPIPYVDLLSDKVKPCLTLCRISRRGGLIHSKMAKTALTTYKKCLYFLKNLLLY